MPANAVKIAERVRKFSSWRAVRGATFFGIPFELIFLWMPLSRVNRDALALNGADERLARPALNQK
jgi:hypothetical protein